MGTNIKLLQTDAVSVLQQKSTDYSWNSLANLGQRYGEKGQGIHVQKMTGREIYDSLTSESDTSSTAEYFVLTRKTGTDGKYYYNISSDTYIAGVTMSCDNIFDYTYEDNDTSYSFTGVNISSGNDGINLEFVFNNYQYNVSVSTDVPVKGQITDINTGTVYNINKGSWFNQNYVNASGDPIVDGLSDDEYYIGAETSSVACYQLTYSKDNSAVGWSYVSDKPVWYNIISVFNNVYTNYAGMLISQYNVNYSENSIKIILSLIYNAVNEYSFHDQSSAGFSFMGNIYIPFDYCFYFAVAENSEDEANYILYFINDIIIRCDNKNPNNISLGDKYIYAQYRNAISSRFCQLSTTVSQSDVFNDVLYQNIVNISYVQPYISKLTDNWIVNETDTGICAEGINAGQPNIAFLQTVINDSNEPVYKVIGAQDDVRTAIEALGKYDIREVTVKAGFPDDSAVNLRQLYVLPQVTESSDDTDIDINNETLIKNLIIVNISEYYRPDTSASSYKKISDITDNTVNLRDYTVTFWYYESGQWKYMQVSDNETVMTLSELNNEDKFIDYIQYLIDKDIDSKIEAHKFTSVKLKSFELSPKNDASIKADVVLTGDDSSDLCIGFDVSVNNGTSSADKFLQYISGNWYGGYGTASTEVNTVTGNPQFNFPVPEINMSEMLIKNGTYLNRLNLMMLRNTEDLYPYYVYLGLNPEGGSSDTVTLGTYGKNQALDTDILASQDFADNQNKVNTLDFQFNKVKHDYVTALNMLVMSSADLLNSLNITAFTDSDRLDSAFIDKIYSLNFSNIESDDLIEFVKTQKNGTLSGSYLSILPVSDIGNLSRYSDFINSSEEGTGYIASLYTDNIYSDYIKASDVSVSGNVTAGQLISDTIKFSSSKGAIKSSDGSTILNGNKVTVNTGQFTTLGVAGTSTLTKANITSGNISSLTVTKYARIESELNVDFIAGGWTLNQVPLLSGSLQNIYTKVINPVGIYKNVSDITEDGSDNMFIKYGDDSYLNINKLIDVYFPSAWSGIDESYIKYQNDIWKPSVNPVVTVGDGYTINSLSSSTDSLSETLFKLNSENLQTYTDSQIMDYQSLSVTVSYDSNGIYYIKLTDLSNQDLTDILAAISKNTSAITELKSYVNNLWTKHTSDVNYIKNLINTLHSSSDSAKQVTLTFQIDSDTVLKKNGQNTTNSITLTTKESNIIYDIAGYTAEKTGYKFMFWVYTRADNTTEYKVIPSLDGTEKIYVYDLTYLTPYFAEIQQAGSNQINIYGYSNQSGTSTQKVYKSINYTSGEFDKITGNPVTIDILEDTDGKYIFEGWEDGTSSSAIGSAAAGYNEAYDEEYVNSLPTYSINTEQVNTPVISVSGNTITITCSTSGSVIYYSIDNGSYTKYTGPVTYTSGNTKVTAKAQADNMQDSEEASQILANSESTVSSHNVTWKYNYTGATEPYKTMSVNEGSAITKPANPSRTEYTFTGWASASNTDITITSFGTMGTSDKTFYAVWKQNTVSTGTVYWMTNDGTSNYTTTIVPQGSAIAAPEQNPTRDEYTFQGWSETSTGSVVTSYGTMGTSDKTFYAIWIENSEDESYIEATYSN